MDLRKNLTAPRVCAVSYLNTIPLVWGFLHSEESDLREAFRLDFALPSVCAARLESGEAEFGIVPVAEIARQGLAYFPATGIACRGPVRSILLISKVPFGSIRTLAVDAGSRSSVQLARVILALKYGTEPTLVSQPADLSAMLYTADAALIIGDPALAIDPASVPFETLDLGEEWVKLTGLPMVFALWAGRKELVEGPGASRHADAFVRSCKYGLSHIPDMVEREGVPRGYTRQLATKYFTEHITYELTSRDLDGMKEYLRQTAALNRTLVGVGSVR